MPNHFCPTPECAASNHNPPMKTMLDTCRHGETEPHGYGMADEPDYDGGEILDIWLSCWGPGA